MNRENCFAYIAEGYCYALTEQKCENCKFYKDKHEAKEQYLKTRSINAIHKDVDKHFMNL